MNWSASELLMACALGAAGWLFLRGRANSPAPSETAPASTTSPKIIGDRFRILEADELIYELGLAPTIAQIKSNLGLSNENWESDGLPLLHNFIRFVQRLPASESHHHAGDGGLVKHTLDVAAMALLASNEKSWPPGAKTEDIARLTPVWRYGILTAALLHDIGKVLTSFDIELYHSANDTNFVLWMPDTGRMDETGRNFYRVLFPERKTAYEVHKTLGWTFFQIIVPPGARRWMSDSDPKLILELRTYLSGNENDKHPMANIIRQADMTSTARDLKAGSRQRFASAKRAPLIEIVMETLKTMLNERGAHFSVAVTAGGDIFRKGDMVYMMAKNVPDKIRDFLAHHHPEYAASFPSDNQRIFDTLFEYGAVLPAPHDETKAVTNISVCFERGDGEVKSHQFTVLQFKLHTLYPDAPYPAEFLGELEVLTTAIKPSRHTSQENGASALSDEQSASLETAAEKVTSRPSETTSTTTEADAVSDIPSNYEIPPPPKARSASETTHSKPEATSIDDFLESHNLYSIANNADTEADTDLSLSPEAEIGANSNKDNEPDVAATKQILPKADIAKKPQKTAATSPAKRKTTPNNASQLKELFYGVPTSQTTLTEDAATSILPIPEEESASAGLNEIQQERNALPADAPRPVEIHKNTNPELVELMGGSTAVKKQSANPAMEAKKQELQAEGKRFLNWLADGLATGTITVNQNDSMIHFIDRGMILVTPLVFKTYTGGFFDKSNPNCPGLHAQQGFLSINWHERYTSSAIYYAFADGKFLFTCFLIPEKNIRFIIRPDSRPPNNTDLTISDKRAPSVLNREKKS